MRVAKKLVDLKSNNPRHVGALYGHKTDNTHGICSSLGKLKRIFVSIVFPLFVIVTRIIRATRIKASLSWSVAVGTMGGRERASCFVCL